MKPSSGYAPIRKRAPADSITSREPAKRKMVSRIYPVDVNKRALYDLVSCMMYDVLLKIASAEKGKRNCSEGKKTAAADAAVSMVRGLDALENPIEVRCT